MKYLVNRVNITLKVKEIEKIDIGYRLIASVPNKDELVIIAKINEKKLKGLDLKEGEIYDIDGFFSSNEYTHEDTVHLIELNIDYIDVNTTGKYLNSVETVGEFVSRTRTIKKGNGKKVCNLKVNFLSENLEDSNIEIAVWNNAVDVLRFAKRGQKMYMASFVFDNYRTKDFVTLKLSPFKLTLL